MFHPDCNLCLFKGVKHEQAIKSFEISCPAGGNQRELARQKNAKKQNETTKGKRNEDGLSAAARKQRYT